MSYPGGASGFGFNHLGIYPPTNNYEQFSWRQGRQSSIPSDAIVVGVDRDGTKLYAGRTWHEGDLLPAKVSPSKGGAFVPWGGNEHSKFDYEVLCGRNIGWTPAASGEVHPRAIPVGNTKDGERLYLGRTMHEGALTPGKIQPSHRVLYIPYGGKEISYREYEVLVSM